MLRLTRVIPYRLELYRDGESRGTYAPAGRAELVRLRPELKDAHLAGAGRSRSRTGRA